MRQEPVVYLNGVPCAPRKKVTSLIKKKIKIFPIYKEIQNGAVAKSYITNGLLIYGEIIPYFLIYWEVLPHILLCNCSTLNFLIYREKIDFFLPVLEH
jgi:hypothetical protein